MKIRIKFKVDLGEESKNVSRTFSNVDESISNEKIKTFAQAFMSLTDIKSYLVEKITTEEV